MEKDQVVNSLYTHICFFKSMFAFLCNIFVEEFIKVYINTILERFSPFKLVLDFFKFYVFILLKS